MLSGLKVSKEKLLTAIGPASTDPANANRHRRFLYILFFSLMQVSASAEDGFGACRRKTEVKKY
jgi:hypothetical protein